jgi:hypothetical protein
VNPINTVFEVGGAAYIAQTAVNALKIIAPDMLKWKKLVLVGVLTLVVMIAVQGMQNQLAFNQVAIGTLIAQWFFAWFAAIAANETDKRAERAKVESRMLKYDHPTSEDLYSETSAARLAQLPGGILVDGPVTDRRAKAYNVSSDEPSGDSVAKG